MNVIEKFKNIFTEEVPEEELKPIKKEVKIEEPTPKRVEKYIEEEEKEEDKFVIFDDDDFKDLETPSIRPLPEKVEKPRVERVERTIKKEEPVAYRTVTPVAAVTEEKKAFEPSPIISPVYGVLDKNYKKEEIVSKKVSARAFRDGTKLTVDDVRNKAYGTIEDDIKDSLLGKIIEEETIVDDQEPDINIFDELEKYDNLDKLEQKIEEENSSIDVDDIFGELDNKKEEILDELDNKKDEILDELDSKKEDIIEDRYNQLEEDSLDDLDLDNETIELSKQLENQRKKLDELNDFIEEPVEEDDSDKFEEAEEVEDKYDDKEILETSDDDLDESELFDLIDSMYEKRDDE